jgi:ammonia channel protein AmtB
MRSLLFSQMFAIITPALITGATADRFRFSACCIFLLAALVECDRMYADECTDV